MMNGHFASDDNFTAARSVDLNLAFVDRQGMAERNEIMSAFRGHDARNNRGVEHRALLGSMAAFAQGCCNVCRKSHPRFSGGYAVGNFFRADVDHGGAILSVQM